MQSHPLTALKVSTLLQTYFFIALKGSTLLQTCLLLGKQVCLQDADCMLAAYYTALPRPGQQPAYFTNPKQCPSVVNCCRHFGGTKLGTGGLARAYGGAARECLRRAEKVIFQRQAMLGMQVKRMHISLAYVPSCLQACCRPFASCLNLRRSRDSATSAEPVLV